MKFFFQVMKASNHKCVSAMLIFSSYAVAVGETIERELHYVSHAKQKNIQYIRKVNLISILI